MTGGNDRISISRRGFVASLASVPVLGIIRSADAADPLNRFRALSARLTGFPEDALDPGLAADLMDGLRAVGNGTGLERLLSGRGSDDDLARRIAVAWYSGIHPSAKGAALATFGNALVWRALDFTKPPGDCSAEPGDWARPPVRQGAGP